MNITVTLTNKEYKALQAALIDPDGWIQHAATEKARVVTNRIIDKLVEHCNDNDLGIASGRDAQIDQAYDLGIVENLAEAESTEE
jgi:hypothetical protein